MHHPGKANQGFPVEVEYEEQSCLQFFSVMKLAMPGLFSDLQMITFFIVELPKDSSTNDQPTIGSAWCTQNSTRVMLQARALVLEKILHHTLFSVSKRTKPSNWKELEDAIIDSAAEKQ